ncbi:CapA family protein [Undibacterium luofuense]|uniref:CapA family protein n=1 Tax=Undibacterium luofuense TaxID=2828733 RepID=A0A941DNZ2_9BURK|nr:CapA family protein [Undibacterium luofuense]MBR7783390.1 CapA family protein [Undibacterium luofuense]
MKKNLLTRICSALLLFTGVSAALAADATDLMAKQASPDKGLTLLFAGDIVPDGIPGNMMKKGRDPLRGVSNILTSTDIRIGNLESVVSLRGERGHKIFTFRAHPVTLKLLKPYFDVLSVANNHSGDFGKTAFMDTLQHTRQAGLMTVGGGKNLREAHQAVIIEKRGLRIAILAYNEFMPRSFEAGSATPGVAWSEDEQVLADIRTAIEQQKADIVIPFMHWGWENEQIASKRQRELAYKMIDAGATAVIGGHPHVTQETEIYRGKPIIYSLGNFLIDSLDNEPQTRGWIARLEIDRQGVIAFDTKPVRLNTRGIPAFSADQSSPCWYRGLTTPTACKSGSPAWIRPGSSALPAVSVTPGRTQP